jgi:hypothetical protein
VIKRDRAGNLKALTMKRLWLALVPGWLGCTAVIGGDGAGAPLGAPGGSAAAAGGASAMGGDPGSAVLKHLLDTWSQYTSARGTLLDSAFALWTNHVAAGPSHGFDNLPVIVAGSAGGFLKQGQYVDAGGVTNDKLLNTLISAAGVPTTNFGQGNPGVIDGMLV